MYILGKEHRVENVKNDEEGSSVRPFNVFDRMYQKCIYVRCKVLLVPLVGYYEVGVDAG